MIAEEEGEEEGQDLGEFDGGRLLFESPGPTHIWGSFGQSDPNNC